MEDSSGGARMTVLEHLEEFRRRIIIALVALVVGTAVSFAFANQLFALLLRHFPPDAGKPVFIEVTEMFTTYVKVCLMAGTVLALPVVLYQIVRFVAPGLTRSERRYLLALLPAVLLFFLAGAAFSYFLLVPFAVRYLLGFSDIAQPQIRIGNFISFVASLLFWVGLSFETPLVILFFTKIGLLNQRRLAGFRRYAFLGAFVVAAVITPTPDPMNQSLVAIPIYLLYELGVLLARFVR